VSERPDKLRSTSASPSTPVSTSPVPDWLSAVFRFKQNPYNLRSIKGAVETREECQRLLREFGVTTQLIHAESGPGVLKCWLEEVRGKSLHSVTHLGQNFNSRCGVDVAGLMTATKSVRFRVECHPTTNSPHAVSGYICVLTLIQEQGASSSFKMIWNMLRRQWDFDTPRTPLFLTVKPAPSPRTGPVFTDAGGYEVE
jgi:serine/threonine-protein kinase HSL1 (negative regulator of Swe1 kinase)